MCDCLNILITNGIYNTLTFMPATKKTLVISDARFRAFVEKSWEVLVLIDRKTRILYATPSIISMFGREANEFMGIQGIRFIHPADIPKTLKAFAQVIASR